MSSESRRPAASASSESRSMDGELCAHSERALMAVRSVAHLDDAGRHLQRVNWRLPSRAATQDAPTVAVPRTGTSVRGVDGGVWWLSQHEYGSL